MTENTPLLQAAEADTASTILSHPDVQNAMLVAGENAANNPAVQASIQQAATKMLTEKGPEAVKAGFEKAITLAKDPDFQAKVRDNAIMYGTTAATYICTHVQQGPMGVRILCFIAGVFSLINAVLGVLSPMRLVFHPIVYTISAYQVIFSIFTMLFEAPSEWIKKVAFIDALHDKLVAGLPLLATNRGRGLFYIFQASLWLSMCRIRLSLCAIFGVATGLGLLFVGGLLIAVEFLGWSKVTSKFKEVDVEVPEQSAKDP